MPDTAEEEELETMRLSEVHLRGSLLLSGLITLFSCCTSRCSVCTDCTAQAPGLCHPTKSPNQSMELSLETPSGDGQDKGQLILPLSWIARWRPKTSLSTATERREGQD